MENNSSQHNTETPQKKFPFRVNRQHYIWILLGFTFAGVLGGFTYYSLIGCNTGGCAITSNPYMSMLWGGAMGFLLPDFFIKKQDPAKEESTD